MAWRAGLLTQAGIPNDFGFLGAASVQQGSMPKLIRGPLYTLSGEKMRYSLLVSAALFLFTLSASAMLVTRVLASFR